MPEKRPPLERFVEKCEFDATTGCVMWKGAQTRGGGRYGLLSYGSFWDGHRPARAHRWAAEHIHGLEMVPGYHVDHTCRNTLCVQHVQVVPPSDNWKLRWERAREGLEEGPTIEDGSVPFHEPPDWFKRHQNGNDKETNDDCPF